MGEAKNQSINKRFSKALFNFPQTIRIFCLKFQKRQWKRIYLRTVAIPIYFCIE